MPFCFLKRGVPPPFFENKCTWGDCLGMKVTALET